MHQQPFQYQITLVMNNFHEITNKKMIIEVFFEFFKKFEKQGSIPLNQFFFPPLISKWVHIQVDN
jgi:hypothetical protein